MDVLVILAHPDEGSFNHAIADSVVTRIEQNGHRAIFHDLYHENFNPLLWSDEIPQGAPLPPIVIEHCRQLASADGIVIIHPNWWGQPPAILKGWIDRVFRPGVAYRYLDGGEGVGVSQGLLRAKTAVVLNTSNTPPDVEEELGDPLEMLWKKCIFDLCGVTAVLRRMFSVVITSTAEQRARWLKEVEGIVDRTFPAAAPLGPCPVGAGASGPVPPGGLP